MSEGKKIDGNVYFIDIPKPGVPVANNTLVVEQRLKRLDSFGNIVEGESSIMVGSDGQGLYTIQKSNPNKDKIVAALKAKMERDNAGKKFPELLGPFDTPEKAFIKMHEVREKTPSETAILATTEAEGLKKELASKDEELATLKAQLEAAKKTAK